jgi:hypothetical protein
VYRTKKEDKEAYDRASNKERRTKSLFAAALNNEREDQGEHRYLPYGGKFYEKEEYPYT